MLNFPHTDLPLSADDPKIFNISDGRRVSQYLSKYKNETVYLGVPHPSQYHRQQCTDTIQSEAREKRILKSQENHRDPTVFFALLIFKETDIYLCQRPEEMKYLLEREFHQL